MANDKQQFPGNGKAPDKSNFAQTCNRLSLFLKEKGNLRDLNLGIHGKFDAIGRQETSPVMTPATTTTTVDLLSNIENPVQKSKLNEELMNQLPQLGSVDSLCKLDDPTNKAGSSKPEPPTATETKTAQMTIFYGGQVLVFDDFPADRARELLVAANGIGKSRIPTGKIENQVESTSNSHSNVSGSQGQIHAQLQGNGSDLPIARRASLHKFLEKRKDRATVRAPYQLHNPSPAAGGSSSKNEPKFDLNL